jgi:uncharacterized DUF497 family protein
VATDFEWDLPKAAANLVKHGVAFEDAARVFFDPLSLFEPNSIDEGEERWQAIGRVSDTLLLVVVHVIRQRQGVEIIRIISARRAERKERRRYDEANGSALD